MRRLLIAVLTLTALAVPGARAQQSNFQVSPPPIAWPFFEPRRFDGRLGAFFMSMSDADDTFSMSGGGGSFIGRYAFNEVVAFDASLSIMGMSGTMPGFANAFVSGSSGGFPIFYYPVPQGDSTLTGFMMPMSLNLEVQPIHRPGGSLIVFGGPLFSFASMQLTTPYYACRTFPTAACTTSSTYTGDMLQTVGGIQFGLQGGIPLGRAVKLSPFFVMTSQSGTNTITQSSGFSNTSYAYTGGSVITQDIEPYTTTSFGMDINIVPWNLSIGTLLQQAAAADSSQSDVNTTMLTMSYHFGSR